MVSINKENSQLFLFVNGVGLEMVQMTVKDVKEITADRIWMVVKNIFWRSSILIFGEDAVT